MNRDPDHRTDHEMEPLTEGLYVHVSVGDETMVPAIVREVNEYGCVLEWTNAEWGFPGETFNAGFDRIYRVS